MKRGFLVALGGLVLATCGESSDNTMNVDNLVVDNLVVNDVSVTIPNYAEEEDGVYSYIAAISEEDKQKGKAAGSVVRFAFRGVQDGNYVLSLVDDAGETVSDSECGKPCRIIKSRFGDSIVRREYTPDSMIGAAFQDALNGHLKVKPVRVPQQKKQREDTSVETTSQVPAEAIGEGTDAGTDEGYGDEVPVNDVTTE